MKYTGEQQIPSIPGTYEGIDIKGVERYRWASAFTHGKSVYDLACGTGYGSLLLEASSYTGFDHSPEAIEYATKYYATPSTTFIQADACAMSPALSVADVIVSFETIEHIKKPEALLRWCANHGKLLLISSPIRGSYGRSRFHLFEYRLAKFNDVLNKYFSKVTMFIQKDRQGIAYPCLPKDKGVAIGACSQGLNKMVIHVYSIMRNEEALLPYFLRHYSTFADTIFIIDDKSTDKTVKIAKANKKVRLLNYKFTEERHVQEEHTACFEKFYKKYSRGKADWVMCVDGDEFIYHKNLVAVLKKQKRRGAKVIKPTGYTMYSETFPTTKGQIYEECFMGLRTRSFDKPQIFDPSIDIKFSGGRHKVLLPEGIDRTRARVLLLHYRYLSLYTSIMRLIRSPNQPYHKKLVRNIRVALDRYEYAILALRKGKLPKVV